MTTAADPTTKRLAVRVTKDAERHVRHGHPWLYDASVTSVSHHGTPGDLAVIFDEYRRFMAIGLWDPNSPIRVKILHAGAPTTINDAWWRARLSAALEMRNGLGPATTGYRWVNGENDGFPGLVIDRYADVAVVKVYAECWFPHLKTLTPIISELMNARSVVLRLARRVEAPTGFADGTILSGEPLDGTVKFLENGLTFDAAVIDGHKTGHFLDQRDNRQRVRELADGRTVLDVFSCTGGFSIYAAAGGARSVVSVDLSPGAVGAIQGNFALNPSTAACDATQIVGDAFRVMDDMVARRDRFDMVIVDPPSFAQNQAGVEKAERAYLRLNRLAMTLVRPGGVLVTASCSSRVPDDVFFDIVVEAAEAERCELDVIMTTGHGVDHPVTFREGAYLKALFAYVHK